MDINQAIQILSSFKGTIDSNIIGLQGQSDAIKIALDQLNSKLEVHLENLTNEQIEATPYFKEAVAKLAADETVAPELN